MSQCRNEVEVQISGHGAHRWMQNDEIYILALRLEKLGLIFRFGMGKLPSRDQTCGDAHLRTTECVTVEHRVFVCLVT